ncbi:MAG: tetratricopeptide repeat protein [Deltaproteobacteria bacterium]|nr:tetratricopeptide repeat protein [Deltaproteobacteria bacterium]
MTIRLLIEEPQPNFFSGDPSYLTLRDRGEAALQAGRPEEAYALFDASLRKANALEDPILVDRAVCNRAAARIVLGKVEAVVPELRTVLNHHADATNSRLAAYNLGRSYEQKKDFKKGAFYARTALNYSQQLERSDWIASSLNLLGICLLGDSLFEEASECFQEALDLLEASQRDRYFTILDNLGYCDLILGRKRRGLERLYRSLRGLRRISSYENRMVCRLHLTFALLDLGHYRLAERHATAALSLAELAVHQEGKKNALYLLGQAYRLGDQPEKAATFFSQLQQEFFPSFPEVSKFLMVVDVLPMINLRA